MIQLTVFMWSMAALFGYIGFTRGWNKELISTSGVILGLFALYEFDDVINDLLVNLPGDQNFAIRTAIFSIVVFFAYQTRAIIGEDVENPGDRDELQTSILGAIVGFINGYLIWGSIWSFMESTGYPLSPYVTRPAPGSASANFIDNLPLAVLGGSDGNLLAAAVIVLFLIVLIVI